MEEWRRIDSEEHDEKPRVWKHPENHKVKVEKHSDGTWDTVRNSTLVENYDTAREAIERCEKVRRNFPE